VALALNRFVELTAMAPARMMGLYARAETIALASDANLAIVNTSAQLTIGATNACAREVMHISTSSSG
jgi:dihydroorotase-like cyclic amidohydrolase